MLCGIRHHVAAKKLPLTETSFSPTYEQSMELPGSPHVLIYLTPWCPYCNRALALLRRKGVDFAAIDVSGKPDVRDWLTELSGQHTVPQIFIDRRSVGGCDELHALDRQGKLDALLFPVQA
jgi:glutaredoxin 3